MTETSFADQLAATGIAHRSGFHVPHGFAPPKGASLGLQAALALYILIQGASIAAAIQMVQMMERLFDGGYMSETDFEADAASLESMANTLQVAAIVAVAICVLAYCVFVYSAASNIQRANAKGHEHSPGWSVGLGFIPIANLVFIFTVMRGVWIASHDPVRGQHAMSFMLPLWWALYIGGNIANSIFGRIAEEQGNLGDIDGLMTSAWIIVGATAASILAAILLILIARSITRAQANWPSLAPTA